MFNEAFCLSTLVMIKRPLGWKVNALGIEVTGDIDKFLRKLDPNDVKGK